MINHMKQKKYFLILFYVKNDCLLVSVLNLVLN